MTSPASPLDDLRRLGLAPGATPDALKPAWRRAVSQLHPDRHGEQADRELADVNAAFQRLQAFLRQHGRLPGPLDQNRPAAAPAQNSGRRWALGALGAAAAAVVLWPQADPSGIQPAITAPSLATGLPTPAEPLPTAAATPIGARAERIELGLSAADVERLAGPPMFRSRERWEYGPSEIRFSDGRVSGWYSSPLRPLPVADIETFPAAGAD
ncbi:MAG: J domain-containing protein [Silanimonas sp.]